VNTHFRAGRADDLAAINALYNHYILNSSATFDLDPLSMTNRRAWFDQFEPETALQLWVAEKDATVVGFACSSPFRAKAGYKDTVETSIYLSPSAHGEGIGHRLYQALFDALDRTSAHTAIAMITLPNVPSIRLHERLNFQTSGSLEQVGIKFGQRLSVCLMQRFKNASSLPGAPITPAE